MFKTGLLILRGSRFLLFPKGANGGTSLNLELGTKLPHNTISSYSFDLRLSQPSTFRALNGSFALSRDQGCQIYFRKCQILMILKPRSFIASCHLCRLAIRREAFIIDLRLRHGRLKLLQNNVYRPLLSSSDSNQIALFVSTIIR